MFHLTSLLFYLTLQALATRCWGSLVPFTIQYDHVDGVELFYREAGYPGNPLVLLLHGSPDSSFYYRNLIPALADAGYHVLAPDYPGFGFTQVPTQRNYTYTFPSLANTVDMWLASRDIAAFAMYVFDFGAPVGFSLALSGKYNISAVVDQNGGAYTDGFGPGIQPFINYSEDPNNQTALQMILNSMTPAAIEDLYHINVPDDVVIEPASYTLDSTLLAEPVRMAAQLSLWRDWTRAVVPAYPTWQAWLQRSQPPLLAIWGKNDPAQIPAGAYAFHRNVPHAEVVLVDAGHFALDTKLVQVASTMIAFLTSNGI